MFIDSHCHLDRIDLNDFDNKFERLLETAEQAKVERMLCVAINLQDYAAMKAMVEPHPFIDISVGVHPCDTEHDTVKRQKLTQLGADPRVVAIGETGLDYYYAKETREQQISSFLDNIERKKQTEAAIQQALVKQNELLKSQKEKTRKRQKQRQQRKKLLAELSDKIKNQENTLSSLENSRSRIENLLKSLGELLADIPTSPSEKEPFVSRKGKLPWPVKGPFIGKFGQPKNYGDLKWNGVLIKAELGTPVRVVSHGRVAFSDWLQGFGFITIIDHGDGYMSLYGHNESLFKQTGDWVKAGEVIATAGDSGGQPRSGVYFEIRSRGKPVNPSRWCSNSARHTSG